MHYNFDNVGNILSVQDNARGETTNYSYDDLNRLMSASITTGGNQYSRSWQYDSIGNMTQRVEGGATTTYQYNDATSKHAVTHLNNVLKYQYDLNGNMTTRDGDTLAYDVENRLTSVTKAGVTTSFVYNGDGARVKRSVSNAGTTYYIGNYFEVYVPNGGSATFKKYYYFGAQRVAAKIAGTLFYLQGDHLGPSSVVMTQAGTSFYSRQTYYPYGAVRTTEGSALPTDYTFTGQKSDATANLMFYGARYYDPALARFIQPDTIVPNPMDPQSLNRYSYVRNNPVNRIDPTRIWRWIRAVAIEQEVVVPSDEPGSVYILMVDSGQDQGTDMGMRGAGCQFVENLFSILLHIARLGQCRHVQTQHLDAFQRRAHHLL